MATSAHCTIVEDMTIYNSAAQKQMLLDALDGCDELNLDLSQVSEMDTAGFQVLLLTKREALKAQKTVRLTAHSKVVTELLDLYNMASYFGDPMVITAHEHAAGSKSRVVF
ncbi:MAG: anti-sigma B factor antagonist [Gallionellales bacterium RIFOXYB12_FULL_54_9]|nr:MAG: anti-sigma B factor antagonist [Gallionellales bacterium RIFOXYB12_FULL_54_9]